MSNNTVQYTIRNIPPAFDARMKAQAKKLGVSLNTLLLDKLGALPKPAAKKPKVYHDMDFLFGSMTVQEADEFDAIIREARETDRRFAEAEYKRTLKHDDSDKNAGTQA